MRRLPSRPKGRQAYVYTPPPTLMQQHKRGAAYVITLPPSTPVEGVTGKTAFSPVRPHIFASVECLALYFNRTHNTQNLLLKKQRSRDIGTAKAKPTHNPRHAAIARPRDIRSKKTSPWHPHHVFLPPSILPWLSGTLPWLQPAPAHLLAIGQAPFGVRRLDEVFCAAAHLHQQLHGLGRPVAPTLSSAHLSAPPVG